MNILEAIEDKNLLGPGFPQLDTWRAWRAFLAAVFGLPMTEEQTAIFRRYTGRQTPPTQQAREAWISVGRRGGKSRISAACAVYLATFRDYSKVLAPGEKGRLPIIASDREQAQNIFQFVLGYLHGSRFLKKMIVGKPVAERVRLRNNVQIEVHTGSFRAVRGYTVVAALCDEIAFWHSEDSANPDHEILRALRPAMAMVPGAMLLGLSSPYARRGVLWDAFKRHYARDGDPVLFWKAPTRASVLDETHLDTGESVDLDMNPLVPDTLIREAFAEDPEAASAEYGAGFRRDVQRPISQEAIDAVTDVGVLERAPRAELSYLGFVDPSGGSADSMTLAIGHELPDGCMMVDAVREAVPPFSPDDVTRDFCALLKSYNVSRVRGDYYGGEWPGERFRAHGIDYEVSELNKSAIYKAFIAALNARRVRLLEHPRAAKQLTGLERRVARGGNDSIDHTPGGHDDVANAIAGVAVMGGGNGLMNVYRREYQDAVARGEILPAGPAIILPPTPPSADVLLI